MSEDEINYNIKVTTSELEENFNRLEQIILRSLVLTRRMGLPDNIANAIETIQRLIVTLQQLRLTMLAVQTASGPIGWIFAGVGLATTAVSFSDFVGSFG